MSAENTSRVREERDDGKQPGSVAMLVEKGKGVII